MKLLPTFASKDKQQEEITRKILRTQEVNDMVLKSNAELARAQESFNVTLATNQAKWALEEEEHLQRLQTMIVEIEALEKRKQQALIPIKMYKQEADNMLSEAKILLDKTKEKDEQCEFLQEKLEEKLTEVADREESVAIEENRQKNAQLGIDMQKEQIKISSDKLMQEMTAFHVYRQEEECKLLKRKEEVSLAEINFNARIEKYTRDLEALKIWDIQLKDERATLDREIKRQQ